MPDSVDVPDVERLLTRLKKLTLLMEVSRSLMGSTDLKKLLLEILNKVRIVMNADKASIFMVDEARNEIFASVTLDGSQIRLPRGTGIIGFVADSGKTVNIPDAYADERFNRDNDTKTGYRTRSILCMPVHNQLNQITGALQVLNKLDADFFTAEDEELLTAFTAMVGVCLENARAYEELAAERNSLEDKVIERTAELALAKAETDQILFAVEEGLFLLYQSDENFVIGAGHSQALGNIFEQSELRSQNFITAISAFVDQATAERTKLFLELMFLPKKAQSQLLKLNPLKIAKAVYPESGRAKFLRFRFNRVMGQSKPDQAAVVDHLLVTVSDVSHEIELQKKLERTEEQNRRQMELLYTILQSEPATLSEYLQDLNQDLSLAGQMMRDEKLLDTASRRNLLINIYRIIHSVKGNSSLLNFRLLTEKAHSMETAVDELIALEQIDDTQLADMTARLKDLEFLSEELRAWLEKIAHFQTAISGGKKVDFLIRALQGIVEKAAASQLKQAILNCEKFDPQVIAPDLRKPVKDLLLQLVRNSVIHGIERAEERIAAKKTAQGCVTLRTELLPGGLRITVEDDGRGIDVGRVTEELLNQKRLTTEQLAAMNNSEKLKLIFFSGVSTHEGVSEFAGRGMGMSIVEDSARQMGASISVDSVPGKFTKFTISFG